METHDAYDKTHLLETLNTKLISLLPPGASFTPITNISNKQETKKIFKLIQSNPNITTSPYMEYFKHLFVGMKTQSHKDFTITYTSLSTHIISQIDHIMLLLILNHIIDCILSQNANNDNIDEKLLQFYSDNYMEYMKTKCEDKSFFEGLLLKRKINHLLNGPCEDYENVAHSKYSILLLNHNNFKNVFPVYFYQKYLKKLSRATYYYLKLDEVDFGNEMDSYIKRFDCCMLLEDYIGRNGKSLQALGKFKKQFGVDMFFQHYEDKMAMISNETMQGQQRKIRRDDDDKVEDI